MKKFLLVLLTLLTSAIFLSSCSLGGLGMDKKGSFFQDDRANANNSFERVLNTIQNKDATALKSLFSQKAVTESEDFDKLAEEFFDYFEGEFISYDDWGGGVAGSGLREDSKEWYTIQPTYDVKTSEQEYRFAFIEYTVNEFEPDKVGIWSLYIIKKEDDVDQECAYRGDGKWNPGINIGIPRQ